MANLSDQLANMDDIDDFAAQRIDELEEQIKNSKEELGVWKMVQKLLNTCRDLADKGATETKKEKLRYKWTKTSDDSWVSEVGSVAKKAWKKYEGFPNCLSHLQPRADDDRGTPHMAHRPAKDQFDRAIDFDTLIDCQLAVEKAHEEWEQKQAQNKKQV